MRSLRSMGSYVINLIISSYAINSVSIMYFYAISLDAILPSDQLGYVQCVYIVKTKYQIALPKAVVGVDRPHKGTIYANTKPY